MIIKGGSRGGPAQLAWHLQRRDTNENISILELQSPASGLREAFRDWQTLVEGTRGTKGLYHANIDPAKEYVMTPEQWQRAVEVLEKELGLEGQPRAVVMHEKHGREHIHVVWARTDIDDMKLRSDSQNYMAHERASLQLENEFGHEHVPGKHAKRDREKQPEFPREKANQAEWQQGERTGVDPALRREQITALKKACDSAQAFKAALEEQGYILAKGDRRDFVIVDQMGSIHSLGRQVQGVKAAELREFMKDIDPRSLPSAAVASALQRQRSQEVQKQEVPKEPEAKKTEAAPADKPSEPVSDPIKAQTDALKKSHAERQAEEKSRIIESQTAEVNELRHALDRNTREKLDSFDAILRTQAEAQRLRREQEQGSAGIGGLFKSVHEFFSPARRAERDAERNREQKKLAAKHKEERDEYAALLKKTNELEIENLTERHALQLKDHATRGEEDLERYMREQETARKLQAEIEERERQREQKRARDCPDKPPPKPSL